MENREVPEEEIVKPLKRIIRAATEADLKIVAENREKEKKAFDICEQKNPCAQAGNEAGRCGIHL